MSAVLVREIKDSRSASEDESRVRRYRRTFKVITDSALDGPLVARLANGIPRVGDVYFDGAGNLDFGSRCRDVEADQGEDPREWFVRVQYGSDPPNSTTLNPADIPENPLERPAEISWDTSEHQRVMEKAYFVDPFTGQISANKVAVTNSAGFPFIPPPLEEISSLVLTIKRNQASFDPLLALLYKNAINEDGFLGAGPGKAKMVKFGASGAFENGLAFWKAEYQIHFREDGWDHLLLDQGYRGRKPDNTTYVFMDDADGTPRNEPTLLNGFGQASDFFARGEIPKTEIEPVYRQYRPKLYLPFGALNLI